MKILEREKQIGHKKKWIKLVRAFIPIQEYSNLCDPPLYNNSICARLINQEENLLKILIVKHDEDIVK